MAGIKGLDVRGTNTRHHLARVGDPKPWWVECSEVDVARLRVELSVTAIRLRGGPTHEERAAIRALVSAAQKRRLKTDTRLLKHYWAA